MVLCVICDLIRSKIDIYLILVIIAWCTHVCHDARLLPSARRVHVAVWIVRPSEWWSQVKSTCTPSNWSVIGSSDKKWDKTLSQRLEPWSKSLLSKNCS